MSGDTSSMDDALAQWRTYKQKAESGEFRMDPQIGDALRGRAQTMLDGLEKDLLRRASDLGQIGGFGTLPSAQALKTKFENKAVNDPDSAVNQLKKHIDLVTLMRDTYALSIRKLSETDQANASQLNNTDV
ncbi:hypothetical protein SAMN04244553_3135 [Nocardia amikacinitolerans]|uniref:Uncharacterized protein n=1 Tax=Nocardia amikacinitolerans TaxID=756689 RepID=A0A285LBZ0_9NOCA|nr:hypothetical protein [Nocardia amikacinitolerans]SNY81537.1 hypothetical protein SAMN04244553_3135 [Nocardia amikacinitolerans]